MTIGKTAAGLFGTNIFTSIPVVDIAVSMSSASVFTVSAVVDLGVTDTADNIACTGTDTVGTCAAVNGVIGVIRILTPFTSSYRIGSSVSRRDPAAGGVEPDPTVHFSLSPI